MRLNKKNRLKKKRKENGKLKIIGKELTIFCWKKGVGMSILESIQSEQGPNSREDLFIKKYNCTQS